MRNKCKTHRILEIVLLAFLSSSCGRELVGPADAVETGIRAGGKLWTDVNS